MPFSDPSLSDGICFWILIRPAKAAARPLGHSDSSAAGGNKAALARQTRKNREGDYTLKLNRPKPVVLIILDGFGYSETKDHNAIALAATPTWTRLWNTCPHTLLDCSGEAVGLPDEQMGNSEVGHLHLGAGRLYIKILR